MYTYYGLIEELPSGSLTNYVAFSTPQLDGRTIVQMVAYLLMTFVCVGY